MRLSLSLALREAICIVVYNQIQAIIAMTYKSKVMLMRVLLCTKNHVVREFVELVTDRMGGDLKVLDSVENERIEEYDFVLLDDRGACLEVSEVFLRERVNTVTVVLYMQERAEHQNFDVALKKPFLPSDIENILRNKVEAHPVEQQILNIQDIDEIKQLLDSEEIEIIPEEDLADELDLSSSSLGEPFLEAMMQMDVRKIRQILQGAEVQITIQFPKEQE